MLYSASRCLTPGGTEEPWALVKTSPVVMQQCSWHSPCVREAITHLILSIILRGTEKLKSCSRSHSGETARAGFWT